VSHSEKTGLRGWKAQAGFSLLEMLLAIAILMVVTGIVMTAMMQMMATQGTISNRTEMHSSVRSATEVLQQEIGQAGRIALPVAVTLTAPVAIVNTAIPVTVSSATGMFNNIQLVVDTGANQETVTATTVIGATKTINAIFANTHAIGAPVTVAGAFATGIVPDNLANGSDGFTLKLYGDVNDDGNMVYIEYKCNSSPTAGNLTRTVTLWSDASKNTTQSTILPNLIDNDPDPGQTVRAPCFKYQDETAGGNTYVVDVSITLTTQTQNLDPQTHQLQKEKKALLNVSPRNIFEGWQMASLPGLTDRIQPMPPNVATYIQQ
jgi:type II secretory pathway pseudopilin PulG